MAESVQGGAGGWVELQLEKQVKAAADIREGTSSGERDQDRETVRYGKIISEKKKQKTSPVDTFTI